MREGNREPEIGEEREQEGERARGIKSEKRLTTAMEVEMEIEIWIEIHIEIERKIEIEIEY